MTDVQKLQLAINLENLVIKHCAQPDGTLAFNSVQQDLALAEDVDAAFAAAGIPTPPHVDQILAGAVEFATMLGVK